VKSLQEYIAPIFDLLRLVAQDINARSEGLMRSSMGVLGYVCLLLSQKYPLIRSSDLADAYPDGSIASYFRNEWVTSLVRETRTNREFGSRTIDTARWAREQVKNQINMPGGGMS
jgi:importin subunit beta-1